MLKRAEAFETLLATDSSSPAQRRRGSAAAPFRTTGIAITLSIAAHAAALFVLIARPASETGYVDLATEAISVEMIASHVLDSVETDAAVQSQVSSAAVAEGAIPELKARPPELQEIRSTQAEAQPTLHPMTAQAAEENAAISGAADVEAPTQEVRKSHNPAPPDVPVRKERATEKSKSKPRTSPEQKPSRDARSERDAAAGARSLRGSSGAKARVSASRGDIAGYAAKVRARVASRRPSGNGARGTVVVSFAVSGSGGLSGARIVASSGNSRLDLAALQAVRGAGPFPPTPSGGQLNFSVPFHYR